MADAFEKFTEDCRDALQRAEAETARHGSSTIATEHLLLGVASQRNTVAMEVILGLGVRRRTLQSAVAFVFGSPSPSAVTPRRLSLDSRAQNAVALAVTEARRRGDSHIDTEHLLLGLTLERSGLACSVLQSLGITHSNVVDYLNGIPKARTATRPDFDAKPPSTVHWWKRLRGFNKRNRAENKFVRAIRSALPVLKALPPGGPERGLAFEIVVPQLHLLESMVVWGEPKPFANVVEAWAILDVVHSAAEIYKRHGHNDAALALGDVEVALKAIWRQPGD